MISDRSRREGFTPLGAVLLLACFYWIYTQGVKILIGLCALAFALWCLVQLLRCFLPEDVAKDNSQELLEEPTSIRLRRKRRKR